MRKPIFKSALLTALCFFSFPSLHAETIADAVEACAKIESSIKRLACFDKLASKAAGFEDVVLPSRAINSVASPLPQTETSAAMMNVPPATAEAEVNEKTKTFGLENRVVKSDVDSVVFTVTEIRNNARKRSVFTMDDGSVWEQSDDTQLRVEVGEQVTVSRGVLGSFFLGKDGVNRRIRVKRIS